MRMISEKHIRSFYAEHAEAENVLRNWILTVRAADWRTFAEIRETFNSADVYKQCVIFNVGGNNYRIIGMIEYEKHLVFIRAVLTHKDYDAGKWKPDCE